MIRHLSLMSLMLTGCLTTSHKIPQRDLFALSEQHPDERAKRVRVVQNVGGRHAPQAEGGGVSADTALVVGVPIWVDDRPMRGPGPRVSTESDLEEVPGPRVRANDRKENTAALLVVAGAVAAGLALTEGLRYDGWASLHPMHPVHLYGPYGQYTWMPLADITPQTALWAQSAYVRSDEGPMRRLGRAPLNRKGWTYSLLLGGGQIPLTPGGLNFGFQSHMELGYFFNQSLGALIDLGLGWAEQDPRVQTNDIVYEKRLGIDLQYLPFRSNDFHFGGYGTTGFTDRVDTFSQVGTSGGYLGLGALLQYELTTRLAVTGRAGVTFAYDDSLSEFLLGISIY